MIRIERRLQQPRWLSLAVPLGSLVVAFVVMTVVLLATHHAPGHTFRKLFDNAFLGRDALNATFVSATPLLFTGLAAAVAFRMQLFNIGGEGQLYAGAIVGAAAGIVLGNHSGWLSVPGMIVAGAAGGAALALDPRRAAGVSLDERDHHVADAQLRHGVRPQLPDLRLASRTGATRRARRRRSSRRGRTCRMLRTGRRRRRRARPSARPADRCGRRGLDLGPLHAHAVRLRGPGDRRLATRRELRGHADAAKDPRGDGVVGRSGRYRGCEPGRRLPAHAGSARPAAVRLRLRRHRHRRARAIQPVRRLRGRVPARRSAERRIRAAGRRLPVRARRRHAGPDPLLRARWRAAGSQPDPIRSSPPAEVPA